MIAFLHWARIPLLALFLLSVICWGSLAVRSRVDERIVRDAQAWRLWLNDLPVWFPKDYRGELRSLDRLPEEVSLRPPAWRERLIAAVEANPWIERVHELDRNGQEVRFEAAFLRPVGGISAAQGFLLLSSDGTTIDFQEGVQLNESWRIPRYVSSVGPLPKLTPGQRIHGQEVRELTALAKLLMEERIFDRWPNAVRELVCEQQNDGSFLWMLLLDQGSEVEWGRSPGSSRPSPTGVAVRLANLRQVLEKRDRLTLARTVNVWSDTQPLVVD